MGVMGRPFDRLRGLLAVKVVQGAVQPFIEGRQVLDERGLRGINVSLLEVPVDFYAEFDRAAHIMFIFAALKPK